MADELTAIEKEQLKLFRGRVDKLLTNEEQRDDEFLIRWLIARDMDIHKAVEMLKKSLEWRKVNGADGILDREDFPEKYRKRFMFGHFGEGKDGFPIIFLPAGRHDHRLLLDGDPGGIENLMKWNIIWMEKLVKIIRECRERTGKPIHQYHEIIDLEGYSLRQLSHKPSVDYILATQTQFDENYPEVLKSVTVINAPRIFPMLFALIKPLLSKQTLGKINIFGTDEEKWKSYFRDRFQMDRIPPRWGGTLKGEDEFCSQVDVWRDAPIPLRYFKQVAGEDEEGFTTVKVPARDKVKVELEILAQNTRVEWEFHTEIHDIAFGVSLENGGEGQIPVSRVTSQKKMQTGFLVAKSRGKVIFIFDNKYSYTTSKSLRYKINLLPPTTSKIAAPEIAEIVDTNSNLYPRLSKTEID